LGICINWLLLVASALCLCFRSPLNVLFDFLNIIYLVLFLPSDPVTPSARALFRDVVSRTLVGLHGILIAVCHDQFLFIVIAIEVHLGPVLGQDFHVIFFKAALKLKKLLEQTRCHFQTWFLSIHELERFDETPPETLHQYNQRRDTATVATIDRVYQHTLEIIMRVLYEVIDPICHFLGQIHWLYFIEIQLA
jgi:hypothetical protein